MNETGNVFGAVLHDYSRLFNRLNKQWTFIKNEFVFGGHLISLCGPSLAFVTMILFNMPVSWEFLFISYLGTYCVYNYDRLQGITIDSSSNDKRSNHIKNHLKIRYIFLIVYVIIFFAILSLSGNLYSFIFGLFLLITGILYTNIFKKMTSKIVGFKNFYTSFSFSFLIFFTAIYSGYLIDWKLCVFFTFIFLHFLVDTSFCDLKDINSDKKMNLKTLPIYLGKEKFLKFLNILNIISFFIIGIAILFNILAFIATFLLIFCLYRIYYINKAKKSDNSILFLSNVIVDAEYFLWPIALLLFITIFA